MSIIYAETSAVLCWLLSEEGAVTVRKELSKAGRIVSSVLTLVETERALVRCEVEKRFPESELQVLRGLISEASATWEIMELSSPIQRRAGRRFPVEPVRTLDGFHLATALEFSKVYSPLILLSMDERIRNNAQALGLRQLPDQ